MRLAHGKAGAGKRSALVAEQIAAGGQFPQLTFNAVGGQVDGQTVTLPDAIELPFAVVLFYRGHW